MTTNPNSDATVDLSKGTEGTTDRPRRKASARTHLAVDWVAGHGSVSAPVAMATTAAGVASLGAWTGLPGAWPLAVGVVGAAGHGIGHGIRRKLSRPSLVVRATGWLLAGGWSSAVIYSDPHTWAPTGWWSAVASMAAIAIGVGSGLAKADIHEEALEEERLAVRQALAEAELDRVDWELAEQWLIRIKAVAKVDVEPIGLERREDGSGFALEVGLPIGFTADRLQACATALAEAARLPVGCLVRISGAEQQGHVIIDIDTSDTSATVAEYPSTYTPLSILTGIPWGLSRIGELVYVYLREACGLILGPPGTGKTTLLDGILAGFSRCVDVITWGIDLGKKGDAFVPWLGPWMEGQGMLAPLPGAAPLPATTRQGVDWVAATPDEVELMLDTVIAVCEYRLTAYRDLMRLENTKLLPVSAKIPMIMLVVDEGAEMLAYTGPDQQRKRIKEKLVSVMRTTRAMGARLLLTATDGNVSSLGDSAVRKYSPVRAALTCTDPEGAGVAKLFGNVRGLDARQLRAKGSGVIGASTDPGFAPMPFRTWVTAPSLARDVSLATEKTRPVLDEPSARAAGAAYRDRWSAERIAWLLDEASAPSSASLPTGPTTRTGLAPTLNLRTRPTQPISAEDQEAAIAAFLGQLGQLPETAEPDTEAEAGTPAAAPEEKPRALPALNLRTRGGARESDGPAWKAAALQILADAGTDQWLATSDIRDRLAADGIQIGRSALSTALSEMARKGEINKRGTGAQTEYGTTN